MVVVSSGQWVQKQRKIFLKKIYKKTPKKYSIHTVSIKSATRTWVAIQSIYTYYHTTP